MRATPLLARPLYFAFCILLSGAVCSGRSAPASTVPAPVMTPDSLVTVAVPDLHGTLDAAQRVADRLLPAEKRINLKAKIGESLGDPGLKGVPAKGGMAFVWDGENGYGFLESTPEAAEAMRSTIASPRMHSAADGARVLFSNTPAGLEAGREGAAAAAETLLEGNSAGVFVAVRARELIDKFRPQINSGIVMMPMMMTQSAAQMPGKDAESMRQMARFVEGEFRVLVSIASQVDTLGVELLPREDSIEYAYTLVAREDTNLHALLTAPVMVEPDPRISVANLAEGMFEIEMFFGNPDAMTTFIRAETDKLVAEMSLDPKVASTLEDMSRFWTPFFTGSAAETVQMGKEEKFSLEYVVTVRNEEEFLDALKSLPDLMEPFSDMYRSMGMPMESGVRLNARTVKDHPVHQFNFRYQLDEMDPATAEPLRKMGMGEMTSELALVDGRALWTMGNRPLEELIARFEAGEGGTAVLRAREIHPEDGVAYFDFDLGGYLEAVAGFIPPEAPANPLAPLAEALMGAPPLTGAVFTRENRMRISTTLPIDIMEAFAKLGRGGRRAE